MKKNFLLILLSIYFLLTLDACKKNPAEPVDETVQPTRPDLSTQVNASVSGFVTDENGLPVEAAMVTGGTASTTTDSYGYFKISHTNFAKSAGFIKVTRPGYFTGIKTFLPSGDQEAFIRLQLIPKTVAGIINASTGGNIFAADGSGLTLPANAVVVASDNSVYTGNINVAMHWMDPTAMATQQSMPGDLRAIDASGYLKGLTTYGMLAVELTGDGGQLLQVAPGQKAALAFPLPAAVLNTAPNTILLWYFDESNGLWKEDGQAVKDGNKYKGDVGHFTYWNCDVPYPLVNVTAKFINRSLQPLSNIQVNINVSGQQWATRTCYTDSSGRVIGMIPANSNLIISVVNPACDLVVYTSNLQTTNTDIDLGTVSIDLQQSGATIMGNVSNCSGSPVTDGYAIINYGGLNFAAEIQNGAFSMSNLICPNTTARVTPVDRTGSQQVGQSQNINLVPGINNVGNLQACNMVSEDSVIYIFDGVTTILTGSQYDFHAWWDSYGVSPGFISIEVIDLLTGIGAFEVSMPAPPAAGTYQMEGGLYLQNHQEYPLFDIYYMTFTEFAAPGGLIIGSSPNNCILGDNNQPGTHTFSCRFHLVRDN